jgi:hypothetical protein
LWFEPWLSRVGLPPVLLLLSWLVFHTEIESTAPLHQQILECSEAVLRLGKALV